MHDSQVVLAPFGEDLVVLTRSGGVDPRLTLADRGLLWALFARSSRAPISIPDLATDLSTTQTEISECISRLIEHGYVERTEIRVKGRFTYQYRVYPTRQAKPAAQQELFNDETPKKPKRQYRRKAVNEPMTEPSSDGKAPTLLSLLKFRWSSLPGVVVPQSQWPRVTKRMKQLISDAEALGLNPEHLGAAISSVYRSMLQEQFWRDIATKNGSIPIERVAERAIVWLTANPLGIEVVSKEHPANEPRPEILSGAVAPENDRSKEIRERIQQFRSRQ